MASNILTPPTSPEQVTQDITQVKAETYEKWEETARWNTKVLAERGSTSPLAWVLTRGRNIPPNAFIAGNEGGKQAYIIRTFSKSQGGICMSKAHLYPGRGAVFSYNNQQFQAETYEVLVQVPQSQTTGLITEVHDDGLITEERTSMSYCAAGQVIETTTTSEVVEIHTEEYVSVDFRMLSAQFSKDKSSNQRMASKLESCQLDAAAFFNSLAQTLQSLRSEVEERRQIAISLEKELAQLKKTSKTLTMELRSSKLKVDDQSGLVASLRKELEKAHLDFQTKSKVVSDLEEQLEKMKRTETESNERFASFKLKIKSLHQQLESAQSDFQLKSEVAQNLEKELEETKKKAAESDRRLTAELTSLKVELTHKTELISSLKQDLERARSDLRGKSQKATDLEKELEQTKTKGVESNQRLTSELESFKLEVTRQTSLVDSLRQQLKKAQSDFQAKSQRATDLEKELAQTKKSGVESNERLTSELASFKLEVERQSTLIDSLRQQLEKMESDFQEKSKVAKNLEKELAQTKKSAAGSNERLTSELSACKLELKRQTDLVSSLRHDLKEAHSDLQAKSQAAGNLETELARVKKNGEESDKRLTSELASLKLEVSGQSSVILTLRQELERAQSSLQAKTQTVSDLEKELKETKKCGYESNQHLTAELASSKLAVEKLSTLVASLRQDLTKAQSDFKAKSKAANELEKELARVKKEGAESNRRLADELKLSKEEVVRQSTSIASLSARLEKAELDVEAKSKAAEDLQKELAKVKKEGAESYQLLKTKFESSKQEVKKHTNVITSLQQQLTTAQSDFDAKIEAINKLEKELARVRKEGEESNHHLTEALESSKQEVKRQSTSITALHEKLKKAELDIEAKKKAANDREKEFAKMKKEGAESYQLLVVEFNLSKQEVQRQNDLIKSLRQQLTTAQAGFDTKTKVVAELEEELARMKKKGAESHQRLVEELESSKREVTRQSTSIDSFREKLEKAELDIEAKRKVASDLERELVRVKKEASESYQRLVAEFESSKQEVKQQVDAVASLRQELTKAQSDFNVKSKVAEGLEKQLARVKVEFEQQTNLVTSLRRELTAAQSDFSAKSKTASNLEKELARVKKEGADSYQRLMEELESSKKEVTRQSTSMTSLHDRLEKAQLDVEAKRKAANELEKELARVKKEGTESYQRLVVELESSKQEVRRQTNTVSSVRQQLTTTQSECNVAKKASSELEKVLARTRSELEKESASVKKGVESYQRLTAEFESCKREVKQQTEIITSLGQQLTAAQSDFSAKVKAANELEKELERMKKEGTETGHRHVVELETSKKEVKRQSEVIFSLREKLEKVELVIKTKSSSIASLLEELKKAKSAVVEKNRIVVASMEEKEFAQSKNQSLMADLEALERKLKEQSGLVTSIRDEFKKTEIKLKVERATVSDLEKERDYVWNTVTALVGKESVTEVTVETRTEVVEASSQRRVQSASISN